MGEVTTTSSGTGSRKSLVGFLALLCASALIATAGAPGAGAIGFIDEWGGSGTGPGEFRFPTSVATDAAGNVYVVDSENNRIQKFTGGGALLQSWGVAGALPGQFQSPIAISLDPAGNVYVLDRGNNRVQKFTNAGGFLHEWGSRGSGREQFEAPEGIATDALGNVYVADTGNNRILKFTNVGLVLHEWGAAGKGSGQFLAPNAVATDAANNVYVSDAENDRIQKFTDGGAFLHEWGSSGKEPGELGFPTDVATDPAGNVYVADVQNDRIAVFSNTGKFVSQWGSKGTGPGQFQSPVGVTAAAGGKVIVADSGNDRIQVFGALSTPKYGKSVNVELVSGIVKVKLPGSKGFVLLTADLQIPVGTVIDTSQGRVRLVSAKNAGGGTQSADFYSGRFKVLQPKGGKPVTVLKLQDPIVCGKTKHLSATASKKKGRGLWGSGKGNFRSEGRHGSATVRGTIWWAQDRCDGTLFKVKKGVVTIKDFTSGKTLKLTAGQKYLAPSD